MVLLVLCVQGKGVIDLLVDSNTPSWESWSRAGITASRLDAVGEQQGVQKWVRDVCVPLQVILEWINTKISMMSFCPFYSGS